MFDMNKKTVTRRKALQLALAMCSTGASSIAIGQSKWPERSIRLVVGFPPGGGVDVMARIVSQPLGDAIGRTIVVENKPGAASNLAMTEVVQSKPDGYTALIGPSTVQSANPFLYKVNVRPATGLMPVVGLGRYQLHLIVRNGLQVRNLRELIAYANANPGRLNYASAGAGTTPHLVSELFLKEAGIDVRHIPYRGSAPALQAIIADEVDFVMDPGISFQHVRAGRARMFAVASANRSRQFPEIPTMREDGLQGLDLDTWVGIWLPANAPEEARTTIEQSMPKVLSNPEIQERFNALNGEAIFLGSNEFRSLLTRETEIFSSLIRNRNIVAE